ncbi:unnamed protein product [Effrenium voratum]|nr:unnamed protein product [Effrenium voratum]
MREIHILVENLTGHDFQLKQVLSPEGGPRGSAPQVLERACKLSWTGEKNGGCALALEFHASRKRFVLAARLPGASWFPSRASHGGTISGIKFSAFVKELPANLSLARALQEAPDLEKHCVRDGCEWLAVRSTEKVLEMRVRLLPPEEQEVPAASERTEQLPAELLERDEAAAL